MKRISWSSIYIYIQVVRVRLKEEKKKRFSTKREKNEKPSAWPMARPSPSKRGACRRPTPRIYPCCCDSLLIKRAFGSSSELQQITGVDSEMIPLWLFVLVLVQSSIANMDDLFADIPDTYAKSYSNELADPENLEIEKKNSDFVRFGRSGANQQSFEDEDKDKRNSLGKNEYFIRYGRNGNRFLRFGRDQNKALRNGEIYIRFGRSLEEDEKNPRLRRSTAPDEYPKRKDAFLRFGRDPENSGTGHEMRIPPDSPLIYLLAEILARKNAHWQNAQ